MAGFAVIPILVFFRSSLNSSVKVCKTLLQWQCSCQFGKPELKIALLCCLDFHHPNTKVKDLSKGGIAVVKNIKTGLEERFISVFNALYDYSIGTLWRIREDLLKERVRGYDQNSDRHDHAGMSINRFRLTSRERIPMLIGRSNPRGGNLKIKGIFPSRDADAITYFGNTFAPIEPTDFTDAPPGSNPNVLTGDLLLSKRVVVNWHKKKVTPEERRDVLAWMSKKAF